MRKVRAIFNEKSVHWVGDGFLVSTLFSHMGEYRGSDPFLLLDYAAPRKFLPNNDSRRGVGSHPHKGFETVTIAYSGEVAHRDSSGSGGVIREGDVQWMTAGAGIIHEEFHSPLFSKNGGEFEMVQLWVNLPRAHKNTPPRYQYLARENIPNVELDGARVRLIAGKLYDTCGAASTFSELNVWDLDMLADKKVRLPIPNAHNLLVVVLRGEASFGKESNQVARAGELVSFERMGQDGIDELVIDSKIDSKLLILSGVPLNEPVVGYGPFVMNTKEEIGEAIRDFNLGKFGAL